VALLSSSAAPSGDRTNVIARFNIEAEELVRGSGHPWTIVRPNAFMSNALRWKPRLDRGDLVRGPWGTFRSRRSIPRTSARSSRSP
jgi:uncharacterized protein YbjT (DUF2867 family)